MLCQSGQLLSLTHALTGLLKVVTSLLLCLEDGEIGITFIFSIIV